MRRSSPGQYDKNYSLESQREEIAAWVEREGHTLVATYSDPGGQSDTLNRPVLQDMLADARKGIFDLVVVWKFDRLSREQEQFSLITFLLSESDVAVISVTQPIPEGPAGTLLRNTYGFVSASEIENIRARTYTGKRKRLRSGKLYNAAFPKYGYNFEDERNERYVIDPVTSAVVRRIFSLYISGGSLRTIAAALTADGIPTPFARRKDLGYDVRYQTSIWQPSTVFHILLDEAYIGKLVGFKRKKVIEKRVDPATGETTKYKRWRERDASDPERFVYGPDVCPPIVEVDVFEQAQALSRLAKERSSRNTKRPNDVLLRGGIGYCAHCRRKIACYWHGQTNRYYYKCANQRDPVSPCPSPAKYSISATRIDTAAWEWFIMKLSQPEQLRAAYDNYQRNREKMRQAEVKQLAAVKTLLAEAESAEQEYLLALGHAGSEGMRLKLLGLAEESHQRAEARQREVAELEQALGHNTGTAAMLQAIETMTPEVVRRLQAVTDTEDKRTALYLFQVRAWIWGKQYDPEVEFTWLGEDFEFTSTRE